MTRNRNMPTFKILLKLGRARFGGFFLHHFFSTKKSAPHIDYKVHPNCKVQPNCKGLLRNLEVKSLFEAFLEPPPTPFHAKSKT